NQLKKKKVSLNKNVKTLINIIKLYGIEGTINFIKLQNLAGEEDLKDDKFYIHFNHACHLGYLRKESNLVKLVSDYE
ncbi:MAG: hypothetical protein ACFFFB_22475, partial [Candidatus Heimdallarchaeota archaeon]